MNAIQIVAKRVGLEQRYPAPKFHSYKVSDKSTHRVDNSAIVRYIMPRVERINSTLNGIPEYVERTVDIGFSASKLENYLCFGPTNVLKNRQHIFMLSLLGSSLGNADALYVEMLERAHKWDFYSVGPDYSPIRFLAEHGFEQKLFSQEFLGEIIEDIIESVNGMLK